MYPAEETLLADTVALEARMPKLVMILCNLNVFTFTACYLINSIVVHFCSNNWWVWALCHDFNCLLFYCRLGPACSRPLCTAAGQKEWGMRSSECAESGDTQHCLLSSFHWRKLGSNISINYNLTTEPKAECSPHKWHNLGKISQFRLHLVGHYMPLLCLTMIILT